MSERMSEDMSERMSKDMSERMSEDMSERMSKDMSERMSEDMSERMSKDMSERMSQDMSEDMSERMSKDMSEVISDQERLRHREPGFCHFVPEYMAKGIWVKLLKGKSSPMEDALLKTWEEQFENVAGHADDAKTLFFVELMHAEFKIDLKIGEDNEKIEVIRWQFPVLHGMLRTAYSAQGLTLDGGVLVDLRRAGGLEDDDWWLAMYVMLPVHRLKVDDNPHLTTTTRHVMVWLTRSKVIF